MPFRGKRPCGRGGQSPRWNLDPSLYWPVWRQMSSDSQLELALPEIHNYNNIANLRSFHLKYTGLSYCLNLLERCKCKNHIIWRQYVSYGIWFVKIRYIYVWNVYYPWERRAKLELLREVLQSHWNVHYKAQVLLPGPEFLALPVRTGVRFQLLDFHTNRLFSLSWIS